MSRYNLTVNPDPHSISYFHDNYFQTHDPRYALLYKDGGQFLFVNLELTSEEALHLALTLNAEIRVECDMINTTYLTSYEDFYTTGTRIVK